MERGDIRAEPKYLTDEQIVEVYVRATAPPPKERTGILPDWDRQFVAGFWDFVLYSFLLVVFGLAGTPLWIITSLLLFLGRWTPVGPISLVHWLTHRDEFEKKPARPPEPVDPYSLTVMRTVAESLTQPLLDSAWRSEERLMSQQETLEALLGEADQLCKELGQSRLHAGDLEEVFDTRLAEAKKTAAGLQAELKKIEKALWSLSIEVRPLRAYVDKLGELEAASNKLAGIRSRMATVLGHSEDPLAQLEFQQLPLRLNQARENLRAISASLQAYEQAVVELDKTLQADRTKD